MKSLFPTVEPIEPTKEPIFHGKRAEVIIMDDVVGNVARSPWVSIPRFGYPSAEDYTEFEVFFYNAKTKYTFRAIVAIEDGLLFPPPRQFGSPGNAEALYWRALDSDPTEEQIKEDEQALIDAPKVIK